MKKIFTQFFLAITLLLTSNADAQYATVLNFAGTSNGGTPRGNLISDGTFLYGMTTSGGASGDGTIFKVMPDGTGYVKLHDFSGSTSDGNQPFASSLYFDGVSLYGMTYQGGASGFGTIFKINPDGTGFTLLYSFDFTHGYGPYGSLISDGTFLYGTTAGGGSAGYGVVFKIKTNGTSFSVLYNFLGGTDGKSPQGDLVSDGTFLYGTTNLGGANSDGTIFKIMPDGSLYSIVHNFAGGTTDGNQPGYNTLIFDGTFLYGTTSAAGANNFGIIFKVKPDGTGFTLLHDFATGPDGNYPYGSLVSDGTFLYGMTYQGGANNKGTIFKIMPDGTGYSVMQSFGAAPDGNSPWGSLMYQGGALYGMTSNGGSNFSYGTVFKLCANPPTVTVSAPVTVCAGVSATLTAAGATSYTWAPASSLNTSIGASVIASPTVTTTYTVTGTNGGCSNTATVQIAINPLPTVALGADVTQCGGSVALDAGNAGSTYAWSTGKTTETISATATGTYSVVVTNASNCTGSDIINVTINPLPTVSLGADVTQCGGSVALDAGNAGSTYAWSTGKTTETISATATGTYSVVVTNASNCTGSDIINVTINPLPTVALGADVTQCGGSVALDAGNAGSTYMWSTSETTETISATATGTYSVVVTNASNCTGSDIINVTINPVPTVALGADVTQCGGSVALDAGNAGSTYMWSTSETTETISATATGTYSVVVTNASNCTGSDIINVTINPLPTVALGADVTQCGGSVALDAGNAGSTYMWSTSETTETISATATGTYSVVVTNASNCTGSDIINVTINPLPTVSLGADVTQCGGSVALDAGNAGSTYMWSTSETTETISATATGTYSVVVTNASNCTGSDIINVTINPVPTVALGADVTQCGGSVALDAGNAGSTYMWSTTETAEMINPTSTGTYSVVVTNASNCTGSDIINVTINPLPTVALGADVTQCGGSVALDAGNAGSTYMWSTSETTEMINPTSTGTYSVVVTNASNCTGSDIINVTINPLPTVALGADVTQCGGSVALDAGNAGSTYMWSTSETTEMINPTSTGTYSVVVTNASNCTGSDIINVTINPLPTVALGADVTQCGGSVALDAGNAGSTYMWSTSETTETISATATGTYSVVVTNASNCTGSDIINVTINPVPTVALGADVTQCGGSVALDAGNAGSTYMWSTSETTETISATATGTYSVVVTNASNCTGSDIINVTINPLPTVALGADVTQCGGSVALDAGNAGSTYMWSTSETTETISATATGTYSVVVTNASNCTGSDIINVTINPLPTVSLGADVTQCGGSVALDAGNAGSTYMWSTSETTETISATATGTYSVVVTNASNCTGSDIINVTINPVPTVALGADVTQCGGSVALDAGNAGSTYMWSTTETAEMINPTSTGTYSVVVTNASNCTGSDIINVTINPLPTVALGADVTQCGGSVALDAGNAGSTYMWSTSETTEMINPTSTGTYSVVVTNASNCTGSDIINVTINPLPTVALGADVTQCGGSVALDAGNAGSTYMWSTSETTEMINPTSTGTYSVVVTNASNCTGSDIINVTINPVPTVALGADVTQCGGSVALDAGNAGSTYMWSTSETTETISATATGTYSVVVTNASNCTGSDIINVTINPLPTVALGADVTQCGGSVALDAGNAGSTYMWSTTETTEMINPTSTGTYSVVVTDANSCTGSDMVDVTILSNVIATFTKDTDQTGQYDVVIVNRSKGDGMSFLWDFGDGGSSTNVAPDHTYLTVGTYTICLSVTGVSGCTDHFCDDIVLAGKTDGSLSIHVIDSTTSITTSIITNMQSENEFNVYPNPTDGNVTLSFKANYNSDNILIRIVDLQGRLIFAEKKTNFIGEYKTNINLENVAKGVCFIEIITDKGITTKRIIVQ